MEVGECVPTIRSNVDGIIIINECFHGSGEDSDYSRPRGVKVGLYNQAVKLILNTNHFKENYVLPLLVFAQGLVCGRALCQVSS